MIFMNEGLNEPKGRINRHYFIVLLIAALIIVMNKIVESSFYNIEKLK